MNNEPIIIIRVAHVDDVMQGPEWTRPNGMPGCMSWECYLPAAMLKVIDPDPGWHYGFTEEQAILFFDRQIKKKLRKDDYCAYVIEATQYKIHDDQVTFSWDGAKVIGYEF